MLQRWSKAVQDSLGSAAGVEKIALIYGRFMQPGLVLAPRGTAYMAFSSAADRDPLRGWARASPLWGASQNSLLLQLGTGYAAALLVYTVCCFSGLACRRAWRSSREWVLRPIRHGVCWLVLFLILLVPCVAAAYCAAADGRVSPPFDSAGYN